MSKTIGILLGVLGIWFGVEVYLNGSEGALGRLLPGSTPSTDETADTRPVTQRAGDSVRDSHAAASSRRERMLSE